MKRRTLKWLHNLLGLCVLAGLTVGCVTGEDGENQTVGPLGKEKEITFSLSVPGDGKQPASYGLEDIDESYVKEVSVLLFNNATPSKLAYLPIYCSTFASQGSDKTFTVTIPEGNYSMVVLANVAAEVMYAVTQGAGAGITVGVDKTTILDRLTVTNSNPWVSNTAVSEYRPIPMWGEVNLSVSQSASSTTINLRRMLSRIDVVVSDLAQPTFKLNSVHLYNYYDKGHIAHVLSNLNIPSIPSGAGRPSDPAGYPYIYTSVVDQKSCEREIYTFEADKKIDPMDYKDGTCLVIGGYYDGSLILSYYRVDFVDASGEYLHLLRNHLYRVSIKSVSGPGFPSPDEAYKALPLNIEVRVLPWNKGDMGDVIFDSQYLLSVSRGAWLFDCEERDESKTDNKLIVYTNYPSGWSIDKITNEAGQVIDWLSVDNGFGSTGIKVTVSLKMAENLNTQDRTGYIYITAGRLTYRVKVTQSGKTKIAVTKITVIPSSASTFVGGTIPLTAKIEPEDASDKTVIWTSSDLTYASVDQNGVVTGLNVKTGITITATTPNGQSATSTIKVTDGYIPDGHDGWAGSNIYYDNGKMTFDGIGETAHENYQGLYFRWGSLYGASASSGDIVYIPTGGTKTLSWGSIPYVSLKYAASSTRAYLYEITGMSDEKGDICRYMTIKGIAPGKENGDRWRLPTGSELAANADYSAASRSNSGTNGSEGKCGIFSGYKRKQGIGEVFFPKSGYRHGDDGSTQIIGTEGHYWSSTPSSSTNYVSYQMIFGSSVDTGNSTYQTQGNSVRCVREK